MFCLGSKKLSRPIFSARIRAINEYPPETGLQKFPSTARLADILLHSTITSLCSPILPIRAILLYLFLRLYSSDSSNFACPILAHSRWKDAVTTVVKSIADSRQDRD